MFERLVEFLSPGPDSRDELIETLADAEHRELIAPESRVMLEGVLRMADMSAGDVMVATPRMDMLDIDAPYDELLALVIDTGHSRFPVYDGERDNIIDLEGCDEIYSAWKHSRKEYRRVPDGPHGKKTALFASRWIGSFIASLPQKSNARSTGHLPAH